MEKRFEELPVEVQSNILKEKPFFPRISKKYYGYGMKGFEEKYCKLDVSVNEINKYALDNRDDTFIIFSIHDEIFDVYICYYNEQNNNYDRVLYTLSIDSEEPEEFAIIKDIDSNDFDNLDDLLFEPLGNNNLYYDIKSVNHIVAQRKCDSKEYTKYYVDKILELNLGGGDIGYLFKKLVILIYLKYSNNIINDTNFNFGIFDRFFGDLIFDDMGDANNEKEYDKILLSLEKMIDIEYKKFIQWLNV